MNQPLKPWQELIDYLTDKITFWETSGFDKKQPETFAMMQANLERAKEKQAYAMRKGNGQ